MSNLEVIAILLSPAFASLLTAMIRRLCPRIDGPALVWGVVIQVTPSSPLVTETKPE